MSVFVSIIVPTYKPGNYIIKCIDSLSNQIINKEKFEVIFVLNGPKDFFWEFIESNLSLIDIKYRLIYNEVSGVSEARNYGLNLAEGDFILFLDDDDFLSLNYLDEMYKSCSDNPNVDILINDFRCVDSQGIITNDYMSTRFSDIVNIDKKSFRLLDYTKFLSSACGKLIKKSIIENVKFEEKLAISEDALFMFTISKNLKNIVLLKEDVFYYRFIRSNSSSRKNKSLSEELKVWLMSIGYFSRVYFSSPKEYNILFYLNRIAALSKFLIYRLFK